MTLAGSVPVLADAGEWDLRGEVEALELAPALALAGIAGGGPVTGTLRVEGPREAPRARADLDARVALDEGAGKAGEPIAVALAASSEGGRVAVERLAAEVAGGRVEGSGRFDAATRALEAKAAATGLDWARLPLLPESLRRLGGTLAAEVSLGGTTEAPSGEAHATLGDATLDRAPLPALAFDARTDGRRLELEGRSGDAAFLKGAGEIQGDWPVRLEIDVARLPAQALLDALTAGRLPDATIEALGTVVLDLALRDPGRFRFAGEGLAASGRLRRVEWTTDPFRVEGTAEEASVAGLRLTTRGIERPGDAARAEAAQERGPAGRPLERAGGTLAVDGRVPFAEGRAFDLAVKGDFTLAAVEAVAPETRASGRATIEAHVGGTAGAPDVDGAFERHGRPPAGGGRAGQRGRGRGPLPRPRGDRRAGERARPRGQPPRDREHPPGDAPGGAHRAAALRGDRRRPLAPRRARRPAGRRLAVVPRLGVGRPRGDRPRSRPPARRGAAHAPRVEDDRGDVRPRRPRPVAPPRRAPRAGAPPPGRAAGDARGERRRHARRGSGGLGSPSPAPSTCAS